MAAGSIAAGLVDGYVRGLGLRRQMNREDEEAKAREEDRAWRKEQQDWMRRERQADDEIDRRLSAVPTTAEKWGSDYSSAAASGAPMRDDEGNLMPGVQSTPRAYRDVLTEQAAAVRGVGGRRGVAMANQLQQFANVEADRTEAGIDRARTRQLGDIQLRQAKALDAWRQAGVRYSRGDLVGSLQTLGSGYEAVPDGRQLVVTNGMFGVATPDGKWVEPPVPINRENVEAALAHAQRFLDPAAWKGFQEVRQGDQRLTDERGYRKDMVGIYRDKNVLDERQLTAQINGGMFTRPPSAADVFTPIGLSDDGTRILGRQGGGIREVPLPPGYKGLFPKVTGAKPERDAAQKAWMDAESKLIAAGYKPDEIRQQQTAFFARRGFAPPEAEAALMAGVHPSTKKPLTAADVAEFNRRYPQSAVQPDELPWLKK